METEVPEENQEEATDSDSDWDNRVLCSNGNCIGVIGPDGCCKECGEKYEGDLPERSYSDNEDPAVEEAEAPPAATVEKDEAKAAPIDDTWENRVLCSDGNCIGIIGPDGKCKECGRPYE